MQICNTVSIEIPATNSSEARQLSNTNGLINENSPIYPGYYYEYAAGVKTGYTSDAGYCLISTASKDGINLMAVVMGGKATDLGEGKMKLGNFTDTIALYEWVFNNFSFQEYFEID
jgi:D-alanyl-D-alanine carboxypeptidase (penicillin-binding protein 5/6)